MAPSGIDFLLTIIIVVGFGIYFAWGIMQMARRDLPGSFALQHKQALYTSGILIFVMVQVGLLYAWKYKTWQPFLILSGISAVTILAIIVYPRHK